MTNSKRMTHERMLRRIKFSLCEDEGVLGLDEDPSAKDLSFERVHNCRSFRSQKLLMKALARSTIIQMIVLNCTDT